MNKREAKRLACFHAALILRTAVEGSDLPADLEQVKGEKDEDRVLESFLELAGELERRGHA